MAKLTWSQLVVETNIFQLVRVDQESSLMLFRVKTGQMILLGLVSLGCHVQSIALAFSSIAVQRTEIVVGVVRRVIVKVGKVHNGREAGMGLLASL